MVIKSNFKKKRIFVKVGVGNNFLFSCVVVVSLIINLVAILL